MKKFFMALSVLFALFMHSCSSNSEEPMEIEKKMAEFTLDYTFESGSMSRTNEEVYDDFYENNIKTKVLVADDYNLTFTSKETGTAHNFKGKWSNEDKITLPVGVYKVSGVTYTNSTCHNKASLKFAKDLEIKADTKQVVLDADYDCWLIMFAKSNIKSIQYFCITAKEMLGTYKDYFYAFCQNENGYPYFKVIRENGGSFEFKIEDGAFENGKYYIFNDDNEASTFNLPKMEAGN